MALRRCTTQVINSWGKTIEKLEVRHRRDNDDQKEDKKEIASMTRGETTAGPDVTFETGFNADGDYWYVNFRVDGNLWWRCKGSFRCDLSEDDEGKTVLLEIRGGDEELKVSMNSGGCSTAIYQEGAPHE